ncbi:MAG: hypothetical protein QF691_11555, partial [SAR324 cluster bacterium]|nr:hypothetical protein [SAR324 cluster bacterium]
GTDKAIPYHLEESYMRKWGCFMAPPAGLKTLKRRRSGLFVRPKQTTQQIHCQKKGRYTMS